MHGRRIFRTKGSFPPAIACVVLEDSPQTLALQLKNLESRLKAVEAVNLSRVSAIEPEHADKATQSEDTFDVEENLVGWSILLGGVNIEGVEVSLDGTLSIAKVDNASVSNSEQPEATAGALLKVQTTL